MKLAEELEKNPNVKEVLYPKKGAMLSFKLHDASKIDKLKLSLKDTFFTTQNIILKSFFDLLSNKSICLIIPKIKICTSC